RICIINGSSDKSMPPVSIILNTDDNHSASRYIRSRVIPGLSSTMETRSPIKRLKIVDFPTFGLPTIATVALFTKGPSFLRISCDNNLSIFYQTNTNCTIYSQQTVFFLLHLNIFVNTFHLFSTIYFQP